MEMELPVCLQKLMDMMPTYVLVSLLVMFIICINAAAVLIFVVIIIIIKQENNEWHVVKN